MKVLRRWWISGPIVVAIIALVLWRTQVWEAGDRLRGVDATAVLVMLALDAVIIVLWAARTRSLLAHYESPLAFRDAVPLVSFANTANGITPASTGEVLRAVLLRERHGIPYRTGAAVILLERFYALGLIVVTGAAAWAVARWSLPAAGLTIALAIVAAALPSLLYQGGVRGSRLLRPLAERLPIGRGVATQLTRQLADVEDLLASALLDPRTLLSFIAWSIAVFIAMTAQLVVVGQAIGLVIDPIYGWSAIAASAVVGVVSGLPFGLGAADATLAALLVAGGAAAPAAGLVTVLLRLLATMPTGLAGALSWFVLRTTGGPQSNASVR